jgi:hypothetical protein
VSASANITNPADWVDPLRGYAYDSINRDALLRLAKIHNGRLEMPGGIQYSVLVVPGPRPMSPNATLAPDSRQRLKECIAGGVPVIMANPLPGAVSIPYEKDALTSLGIDRDVMIKDTKGIAWVHRTTPETDIYFFSNQQDHLQTMDVSLRVSGRIPELWDPLTGEIRMATQWRVQDSHTILPLRLEPQGSIFVVLRQSTQDKERIQGLNWMETRPGKQISGPWQVTFDPNAGGPKTQVVFEELSDWSLHKDPAIKYYSGTALYMKSFEWSGTAKPRRVWLDLGQVANLAEVILNGQTCGVAWTAPYCIEITKALREGANQVTLHVTNTWANRLIGDSLLSEPERMTWTLNPERVGNGPLLPAGLLGPVQILVEK